MRADLQLSTFTGFVQVHRGGGAAPDHGVQAGARAQDLRDGDHPPLPSLRRQGSQGL